MVHFCAVPGCLNRSNRDTGLSFFSLPLKKKALLKVWIHKIRRKNLPLNSNTRVCSNHFISAVGRRVRPDEYPTRNLPSISTRSTVSKPRKPPKVRSISSEISQSIPAASVISDLSSSEDDVEQVDVETQTSDDLPAVIEELKGKVMGLEEIIAASKFCIENIANDDPLITFYTGFPSYDSLKACYEYLGPGVNDLKYWGSNNQDIGHGIKRLLSNFNEFFLVLVRLRLGLFEKDLANRFNISTSTVCRICRTWIRFMYLRFKEIPLWPSRDLVNLYMPKCFKELYPSTRVIIDATEIFVETPALPEFQQMTFSSYKNHNTFKALVGISPGGAITYVSTLYPGSISDQQLTKKSGLIDLLEKGDSVMADRGFNIQDDLTPLGVRVNIPPFLKGKTQLEAEELVETRRIASLRIHVERAMERIKNYHIFDRTLSSSLTDLAEETFFVCAVMCNFLPPLCT